MWLTGNAGFTMGDTQLTIPIIRVSNGELFGSKPADREQVGSATISANSCNDLTFEFDLGNIGLSACFRWKSRAMPAGISKRVYKPWSPE